MTPALPRLLARPVALAGAALLLATPLAVGGCSPLQSYQGFQADQTAPKDLKVGEDTKATVRSKVGSPSMESTFDKNNWFYISQISQRRAFFRPKLVRREIVSVTFDDSDKVSRVDQLSLADGKVVAFNGRETPTRGRELTILEQILGNVGRGGLLPDTEEGQIGNQRR